MIGECSACQTFAVRYNIIRRHSLRRLLIFCIFICFLGLIAIIVGSFTPANVHGIPVIKVVGGIFLIVGVVLSIISGAALIRLPTYSTQTVTAAHQTASRQWIQSSVEPTDTSSTTDPVTALHLGPLLPSAGHQLSIPPPYGAPPSYEEAVRQESTLPNDSVG